MKAVSGILAAAATGALATYFLDPEQGRRRRAVLRDKVYSRVGNLDEAGRVIAVDLRNRAQGTLAALRQRAMAGDVPDDVLVERVRARLGRVVAHPGSVEVAANEGVVTLRGPVLKRELKRAMQAVWAVPGVQGVENKLEAHEQIGNISGLQGGQPREQRIDILQEHWAPATRMLVGGGGAFLAACGLVRRSPLTLLLGAAGAAMLVRAATNLDVRRLLGQRGRSGVDFKKTLHIAAPVGEVFGFWSNFGNFPKLMRNATVTQSIPNERIAWSTTPGAQVQHAGIVRFQQEGGGTRVQIETTYNPEMDDDLMRLKACLETGKPARDAAREPA